MAYKPFKMKASGRGNSPMKKNYPSVFKKDPPGSKKTKVFGGKGTLDTSTQKGKNMLKEIKSIPTTSSSEKGRITVKHNPKAKYGQTPPSGNKVKKTVYKPSGSQYGTWTKVGKKIAKGVGKIAGKALMGGVIDPTNKTSPRLSDRKQFKSKVKSNNKKYY